MAESRKRRGPCRYLPLASCQKPDQCRARTQPQPCTRHVHIWSTEFELRRAADWRGKNRYALSPGVLSLLQCIAFYGQNSGDWLIAVVCAVSGGEVTHWNQFWLGCNRSKPTSTPGLVVGRFSALSRYLTRVVEFK